MSSITLVRCVSAIALLLALMQVALGMGLSPGHRPGGYFGTVAMLAVAVLGGAVGPVLRRQDDRLNLLERKLRELQPPG